MRSTVGSFVMIVLLSRIGAAVALEPTIKVDVESPQRPVISGQTNLPNGTELMISISRNESNFSAQDRVKVAGGKFRTVQFSQKGADFNPGKYKVEVLMPYPPIQSQAVREVIGEHGEKLSGGLVKHESLGNLVKYTQEFEVGGGANAQADKAARAQEIKDKEKWVRQSCNDILDKSEQLRKAGKFTVKEATPDERQVKFDNCVKEVSGGKAK